MIRSLDVIFSPDLLPFTCLEGKSVVVIDILRATTTITFAIANGATYVQPVLTPEEAFAIRQKRPNMLIGGERHGKLVDGFNLGNSPSEYQRSVVSGRSIIITTTNGTRTMHACVSAKRMFIGSFLNLGALIRVLNQTNNHVAFVCSGREGQFCTEDALFAGACVNILCRAENEFCLTDSAKISRLLFQEHHQRVFESIQNSDHGRYLASIGLESDLKFCSCVDLVDVVPVMIGDRISLCDTF